MRKEKTFVVRLWSDSKHSDSWRASLEDLKSKEKKNFSSLEKLSCYLQSFQKETLEMSEN